MKWTKHGKQGFQWEKEDLYTMVLKPSYNKLWLIDCGDRTKPQSCKIREVKTKTEAMKIASRYRATH